MSILTRYAPSETVSTEALVIETNPVNALFEVMDAVSNEAMNIGDITGYFARRGTNLNLNIREGLRYLTTMNHDPLEKLNPVQMASFVKTLDYLEIGETILDQPVGLKGELLPYITGLQQRSLVMSRLIDDVIRPATTRFGHYLSHPVERAERRVFAYGADLSQSIEQLIKAEAAHFTQGSRSATAPLNELYGSLNDFVLCEQGMVAVKTNLATTGPAEVRRAVSALSITSKALIERLGKENSKTSNEFVKMFADEMAQVARWIEWYAIQMTRIIETNNVLYKHELVLRKL